MNHVLVPSGPLSPLDAAPPPAATPLLPPQLLEAEADFYRDYAWCLNPHLTVGEVVAHLTEELHRLKIVAAGWQRQEILTNIYLLAGALLNSVDDYLRGPLYHLPRRAAALPLARLVLRVFETVTTWRRARRVRRVLEWRGRFSAALAPLLRLYLSILDRRTEVSAGSDPALAEILQIPLPMELQAEYSHIPSAFRKQDLTPLDVLPLARQFCALFPARQHPLLVVGLRTAGSYLAPLCAAVLETEGYATVESMTLRPSQGPAPWERAVLQRCARAGYRALLLDDPPFSGDTLAQAVAGLRQLGFSREQMVALFPVHPQRRQWATHQESVSLAQLTLLTLEPERWHKIHLLESAAVERRLAEYFHHRGYVRSQIVASAAADALNAQLTASIEENRHNRLKRVYAVQLETADGKCETRHVLAKSVGWGYLSYHAFLSGSRLAGLVPPLLGLRDGLLFLEWIPQPATLPATGAERERWITTLGSYVAARTCSLRLPNDPTACLGVQKQHDGFELLNQVLGRAYGGSALRGLMGSRLRRRLAGHLCPVPTFIDAKMRPAEWRTHAGALLKTDFEHHGLGKNELNVVDPAFDLAEAILHLALTPAEEELLLQQYQAATGDTIAPARLFLYKLLAGLWSRTRALRLLAQSHLAHRQHDFHRDYVRTWDFLTVQAAHHCGRWCRPATAPAWKAPLMILDVDGVIDRRLFGFPCTSAAGLEALALLYGHGFALALNTARSAAEVKEYCAAYGCAGAVAEYGSYLWDAVRQRGRSLISSAAQRQLERLRQALWRVPGVFVNEGYEYSLRACTYTEEGPEPLPTPLIQRVLADQQLEQLTYHQTTIDTTILAREVNKGTGLTALLDWVGIEPTQTLAVGDSEPDLAMFRVAHRCFAPAHISCGRLARFLGCEIAPQPYQRGLLHIVRSLVAPRGGRRQGPLPRWPLWQPGEDLFLDLLTVADEPRSTRFRRALFHPAAFSVFRRRG
jgi:hydroxymethylpyrimidine pyrophosphatase-like HAD family hydrolase